jgi:hypothetical protein
VTIFGKEFSSLRRPPGEPPHSASIFFTCLSFGGKGFVTYFTKRVLNSFANDVTNVTCSTTGFAIRARLCQQRVATLV